MNNLPLAFLMGLLGSLHCAVMCGPLMLSLPLQKTNYLLAAGQLLSYQLGRILVYTVLGMLVGWIGNNLSIFASQETLSLLIGVVLVLMVVLQLSGKYNKGIAAFQYKMVGPISKLMGKLFGKPFWGLFAGMLNALIPCGMVYLALSTALNTATIKGGASFMFLFGLGTSPLMLLISLGGIYLKKYIRFNTQRLVPWFMFFVGTLFILRAAELGIPFFSPINQNHVHGKVEVCR